MVEEKKPVLVVLGTGGTISGGGNREGENLGYTAGLVSVETLVGGLPAPSGVVLETRQVAQIDSKNMSSSVWRDLFEAAVAALNRPDVQGVVITHGTDTLEETGFLLSSLLQADKPVVLTCAMRPATAAYPDGPQNLADALQVAACPGARGVMAVCAGRIHDGQHFSKVHTYRLDPFDSGEAGVIGYVEEGRVRCVRPWPRSEPTEHSREEKTVLSTLGKPWPRVEIVLNHAQADGQVVTALLWASRQDGAEPLAGLVLAGTGNGTCSEGLSAALSQASECGVTVWRASRCCQGAVLPTSLDLFPSAGDLPPVKARIALALHLMGLGRGEAVG
ncbi:asparaginase [Hydrogenophaga sp. 5NK40-0174]|uniref:asparaginase n=1 Tax=Hydrogenophaga sp. 5NK40-0174 TaxID=3127649 RepID=UPI0031090EBD